MKYVIHPGTGRINPTSPVAYIDAGTLAALYGLGVGEYILSNDYAPDAIHLTPRQDGLYTPIKSSLHDNGTENWQDYPAFMHTTRDGKYKSMKTIQPQYKDSFRDRDRVTN